MGTPGGALVFRPSQLTLKLGRMYRLRLSNPSGMPHNWVATEFLMHGECGMLVQAGFGAERVTRAESRDDTQAPGGL